MNFRIKREVGIMLLVIAAIALVFLIAYMAIDYWDRTTHTLESQNSVNTTSSNVITIDGKRYTEKEHVSSMLLIGVDNTGVMESNGSYLNDGQSDFLTLIILDEDNESYSLLQINRDTMTDVRQLGVGGNVVKTATMQIALSHTYGDGMEDSCENTVIAVENLLCDISIDHYLALNMTAVELIVDSVGGITITIQDDFSDVDAALVEGETMTLTGSQCLTYIRARKDVGDQTNITRMARQKQFISELLEQLPSLWADNESSAYSMFYDVSSYILTDLTVNQLSDMFDEICGYECSGIFSPDGELVLGDEYYEYYVDEDSVKELVIELFLDEVEE